MFAGVILCVVGTAAHAAGNISDADKYSWSETAGWINFNQGHVNAGVTVYSDHLEGFTWAENIGWVKLGGSPYYANTGNIAWGVNNDGSGNLSGYAWSEVAGWICFDPGHADAGVTVNTADSFNGYAWYAFHPLQYKAAPRLLRNMLQAVHRFYSEGLQTHLFTTDENEKAHLIENAANVWRYEGPAFYVPTGNQEGMLPVYRFYS